MGMRLPRLLDKNLQEVCRLEPSALTATINLTPLSTASMTLPEGEASIGVRDWIEVYGQSDSFGIFRVSRVSTSYGSQQKISLEHGITTLGDDVTEAETTLEGSISQVMTKLLSYQSTKRWQLGSAPTDGSYTLEVNRTNVLQAVLDLLNQTVKYALTFDQSTSPWTVNVAALSDTPMCEARINRNIMDVTSTTDDSELCTRVYAAALPDGYLDADTVSVWGVIGEDLGIADDADQSEATSYAKEYLKKHQSPTVSIELDGLDLSEATGEALDRFRVGELCRIALPEWETAINERVITLKYSDLLKTPERVRLTLSTAVKDTSQKLAGLRNTTNTLTATTTRYGSSMRTVEADLEKTYQYTQEIDGRLVTLDNYVGIKLDEVNATITLKASQLQTSIDDATERISSAEIAIDGANATIALKANQSDLDETNNLVSEATAELTVQAGLIESKVSKDGVISSINQTPESVTITASKINLIGYVTASQLASEVASIKTEVSSNIVTSKLTASTVYLDSMYFNDDKVYKRNLSYISSVTFPTAAFTSIQYVKPDGSTGLLRACSSFTAGSTSTTTVGYLGY